MAVFALTTCLPATPQPVAASVKRTIHAGYYDAKPSCWRDEAGAPRGIFIDTLNLLASSEGWTVEYIFKEWDDLLDGLRTGSIDLVPAIVKTPEREKFAIFTEESVMSDWGEVFANPDSGIRSILDLDGLRVGALENDFWFSGTGSLKDLCAAFGITPKYVYYADYSELFRALNAGSVDAAAASNSLGLVWQPLMRITPTPVLYNPIELRFAASRYSPSGASLAGELDRAIRDREVNDPGSLRRILEEHAVPTRMEFIVPTWISLALTALVIVLAATMAVMARQAFKLKAAADGLRVAKLGLERSLAAKDVLVHELSHRVMNNLQIILSLVNLVDGEAKGEAALPEIREKIYSISFIEDELHARGAIDEASLRSFFDALTRRLAAQAGSGEPAFALETELRGMSLVPSAAVPLALILSELTGNAALHGRDRDGRVDISVRVAANEDGSGEIVVRDQGPGFPEGFDPDKTPGLGYRLIGALVSQLGGRLSVGSDRGASVRIVIPGTRWTDRNGGDERAGDQARRS